MNPSTITSKQQDILLLLYRHQFLTRKHIQLYFGHADKRRSARWLHDLHEKRLIGWRYDPAGPGQQSEPALYFLVPAGIRHLRGLGRFPEPELRKRYKDGTRQRDFIDRCLVLAECCLHLEARNKAGGGARYTYALPADRADSDTAFYPLYESTLISPDLAFTKHAAMEDALEDQTYLVQLFSPNTPRHAVKRKLRAYIEYLLSDEWVNLPGSGSPPVILIACPTVAALLYAKRYVRKQLSDAFSGDVPDEIAIRFTPVATLRSRGLTAVIWEDY